jgi:hypothetical protein
MNRDEVERFAAAARRLGCTPRELLVAAATSVDAQGLTPVDVLRALQASDPRVQACADLLLTPPGSYATDELDHLLASLGRTGDH